MGLMLDLCEQVLSAEHQLLQVSTQDARRRLAAALHHLATEKGLLQRVTHASIARQIGSRRETVTRLLSELEDQGYIQRQGRQIQVRDLDRLASEFGVEQDW